MFCDVATHAQACAGAPKCDWGSEGSVFLCSEQSGTFVSSACHSVLMAEREIMWLSQTQAAFSFICRWRNRVERDPPTIEGALLQSFDDNGQ